MHRLTYSLVAGQGQVLLVWSEPIQHTRMPYPNAYAFAKQLVAWAQRAETQAALVVDRSAPPEPVQSTFRPEGGDVCIDWGVHQAAFSWPSGITFAIANAIVQAAEIAQRWGTKGPSLTPREVDRVEETILGKPALVIPPAASGPAPSLTPTIEPGGTYLYRPTQCLARILKVNAADARADIVLPDGTLLLGVAWGDLLNPALARRRRMRSTAIGSGESLGQPGLG